MKIKSDRHYFSVYGRAILPLLILITQSCSLIKDIEKPQAADLFYQLLLGSGANRIGVVSSDLGPSGRFSVMHPEGVAVPFFTSIHSDAMARYFNGRVFIVNRLGRDGIQVLDPQSAYLTVSEYSTGNASNPHDIVVTANGKGYISLYGKNNILVVQPESGAVIGSVSLAAYSDPDGYPEVSGLHAEGNRVFAAVQRLYRNDPFSTWPPVAGYPSLLVEIDAGSDTIVAAHAMPFSNPFSKLRRVDLFGQPHLVVACPSWLGYNFRIDGGIIAFNLATNSFKILYRETAAGGDILDVVIKNDSVGYASILFQDFSTAIQRFNPTTGARTGNLLFAPNWGRYVAGMLLTDDGRLYLGDSSYTEPGISIYDTNAGDLKLTPLPVPIGLRPTDLVYIP
ncbi:hypothetical protein [Leptonema illini]|uniref:Lipoprotein n=1 Tax=Leptonema illini DSM 21528 TaxID=929563 RepID=H2C9Z0_9LEPT|nr:hypothetical protein [Leptonema illini]EHQ05114.1 hypothetical protein Lepil_0408 [Leptonema illini DSM 21528]